MRTNNGVNGNLGYRQRVEEKTVELQKNDGHGADDTYYWLPFPRLERLANHPENTEVHDGGANARNLIGDQFARHESDISEEWQL